ncbi:MAG: hypothetical protein ACKVVP_20440 [Chloroflexota bacterium]
MQRVTVLFDDVQLYRTVKSEAAKAGRPVKDVVAEALSEWLRRRCNVSPELQAQRRRALELSEALLAKQPVHSSIQDTLDEIRLERS